MTAIDLVSLQHHSWSPHVQGTGTLGTADKQGIVIHPLRGFRQFTPTAWRLLFGAYASRNPVHLLAPAAGCWDHRDGC